MQGRASRCMCSCTVTTVCTELSWMPAAAPGPLLGTLKFPLYCHTMAPYPVWCPHSLPPHSPFTPERPCTLPQVRVHHKLVILVTLVSHSVVPTLSVHTCPHTPPSHLNALAPCPRCVSITGSASLAQLMSSAVLVRAGGPCWKEAPCEASGAPPLTEGAEGSGWEGGCSSGAGGVAGGTQSVVIRVPSACIGTELDLLVRWPRFVQVSGLHI